MDLVEKVALSKRALQSDGSIRIDMNLMGDPEDAAPQPPIIGSGYRGLSTRGMKNVFSFMAKKKFCQDPSEMEQEDYFRNTCFFQCIALEIQ